MAMITTAEATTWAGFVGTVIGWQLGLVTDGTIVTGAIGGAIAGPVIVASRLLGAWLSWRAAKAGLEWVP